MMRLGREMRRRVGQRAPFVDVLRDAARRMEADAVLLWMPACGLRVPVATQEAPIATAIAAEFAQLPARIGTQPDSPEGLGRIVQGDETGASCRQLITSVDTGSPRSPAWLVFARTFESAALRYLVRGTGAGAVPEAGAPPAARSGPGHRTSVALRAAHGDRAAREDQRVHCCWPTCDGLSRMQPHPRRGRWRRGHRGLRAPAVRAPAAGRLAGGAPGWRQVRGDGAARSMRPARCASWSASSMRSAARPLEGQADAARLSCTCGIVDYDLVARHRWTRRCCPPTWCWNWPKSAAARASRPASTTTPR